MSDRPRYPKSTCCIPGCTRWSRLFPMEWMCGKHWKMVPRAYRAVLRRNWKHTTAVRDRWQADRNEKNWVTICNAYDAGKRLWARAKRHVIFRSAGI